MQIPLSENYELYSDGRPIQVYHTSVADFAIVCFTGEKEFRITAKRPYDGFEVRPVKTRDKARLCEDGIRICLTDADRVSVEPYGREMPLYIWCAPYIPKPDNATYVFPRGSYTDIGCMELKSGETVYIEEGAVVTGGFRADRADNITITGNGIIWNTPIRELEREKRYRAITPIECRNVGIYGISMIDHMSWHVVPMACTDVTIRGLNILGIVMTGDGIDIVGCENVSVSHCFIRVNDDCLVVKGSHYGDVRGCRNSRNLRFFDCVLWKAKCGNAVEIGYETRCEEIKDVIFEDIDIIHCELEGWQSGGVFTIHNGDRAYVHDITYRDIRIEEADEKLIDFKILSSKYSSDTERGRISDILFDGVKYTGGILPPSIIRGYESETGAPTLIENIHIRNLFRDDEKILSVRQAHIVAELSQGITFE